MYVTLSSESTSADQAMGARLLSQPAASHTQHRTYATGANLFHEGDTANHVYEVKSGVLRLTRVLENGRRQVIAFGLPGDIIGFPNGDAHHTDCDVVATAEIIAHRRSKLETGAGDPETHQRLLRAALREITAMQDHFMMLARKSAAEKVASFLLAISNRTGAPLGNYTAFSLPMSRADIADFLGLTVETVSRTFSILRKDGVISLETPQTVLVLDTGALLDASQSED
ncbi:CRP/FNR family transcriptional regulator, nitrogen fixation regulation protein [Sulfitobacter marinus]|uniref:CRP/FNR family transcriptional regulator, nitrogen fixation regulation protein n=1 Tax=Sulfitobacter marinus TaxID=394264 RepID=A0A1I6QSG3_9RHOB|nr:helix-turn-helix domain-containing protein [Sulfitobacter marinus]SFS55395.1 CRP/FNR family transcriptional regulator, nitrogen fixation regulation protein [Sulfitobacter marinus]